MSLLRCEGINETAAEFLLRNGKKVNTAGDASGSRRGRARPRPGDEGELGVSGKFHCGHDGKARNVVR